MMTTRLQDPCLPELRTLVVACAEANAYDPTWRETLHRHALVIRPQGGDVAGDAASLVAAALCAHPIERVLVLGHLGCRARAGGRSELTPNTAAVAAFHRYADAACSLVRGRARGELSSEHAGEKLDVLVRLANLEACAELHGALRSGAISAHGLVYDPATREVELFDGAGFRRASWAEIQRMISGAGSSFAMSEDDFASPFPARAPSHAPALAAQAGAA